MWSLQYTDILLLLSLFTSLITWYAQWRRSRRHLYKLAAKIPRSEHVTALPIIGDAHCLLGNTEEKLKAIMKIAQTTKPLGLWLGPFFVVVVSNPKDLEVVLGSPDALEKAYFYGVTREVVGEGLISAPLEKWKKHRKLILPSFNQRILNCYVVCFVKHINKLLELLETETETFDVNEKISFCAMDAVCENVMGIDMKAQSESSYFSTAISTLGDLVSERMFNILLHPKFIFRLSSNYRKCKQSLDYLYNLTYGIIFRKRSEKCYGTNSEDWETGKNKIFLEHFMTTLKDGRCLTDAEIRDEVMTLLLGGIETNALTMSYFLLMMGMHKDIQEEIYDEIIEVIGYEREVSVEDLIEFKKLDRAIKETLRLFPPLPVLGRKATKDIKLESCVIPKGADIALPLIVTHRSPDYYDEPLKFDPNRFLPENIAKRHSHAYIPFSAGRRNCIGLQYANLFMRTIAVKLLRKYEIDTDYKCVEDIRLTEAISLQSLVGYKIRIKARNVN